MKKLLLAACAVVAMPAFAQGVPPAQPGMGGMGGMSDRVETRADLILRTQRMFAIADTNHDGVIDQAEAAAAISQVDGKMAARGGDAARMPLDRNAVFDRIDTNHDGSISRDEFARQPAMGGEGAGRGEPGKPHGGGMGGMARMLAMADTNHDGRITLQEAIDFVTRRFDMMDLNHDGRLTPEERAAARAQMGAMHGQR